MAMAGRFGVVNLKLGAYAFNPSRASGSNDNTIDNRQYSIFSGLLLEFGAFCFAV
jgi:hypothetical protein